MLNYLIESYSDPMFLKFPVYTTLYGLFLYLLFALPLCYLAYRDPPSMWKYRVHQQPIDVLKFFWPSLVKLLKHNFALLIVLCVLWPLARLAGVHDGPLPTIPVIILEIIAFFYVDDFLTFWVHKSMHRGWLYRNVHSVHHRIKYPSAMDNSYFHWIEFFALMSTGQVLPLMIGAHITVIWIWLTIRIWQSVVGHCGYTFPWDPVRIFPLYEGGDYHYYHHIDASGNLSGIVPYLDRFWGRVSLSYLSFKLARHSSGKSGLFKLTWKRKH